MKNQTIRQTFPKIRIIQDGKGVWLYQIDSRRQIDGKPHGTRDHIATTEPNALERAKALAESIAAEHTAGGTETLAMSTELRAAAIRGERILAPYGKTIDNAVEFYRAYLEGEEKKRNSALVGLLADKWIAYKESGNDKTLAEETLRKLKEARKALNDAFGKRRILDVTTADVRGYLNGLTVGKRRKFDINSRWSQFWNWAISEKFTDNNPCASIEIVPDKTKVEVLTPDDAQRLMTICETQFPKMTLFYALATFAGLRPDDDSEAQSLVWEDIDLEARTIFIHADKTKVNEDRSVPINDNLYHWLTTYKPAKAKGLVTEGTNFKKRRQAVHIAMGYKAQGENQDADNWPQDLTRHSYCSYQLAMGHTKGEVAEWSGNSPKIIKKHYKRVLPKSDALKFWSILPAAEVARRAAQDAKEAAETEVGDYDPQTEGNPFTDVVGAE